MRVVVVAALTVGCGRVGFGTKLDAIADVASPLDAVAPSFVDLFDRPDAATLGNGWTEKQLGCFGVQSHQVVRLDFSSDYRNDLAYRPVAEDVLDEEVSIAFTVGHVPPGYPQVHLRVQRASVTSADTLDSYLLYIDGLDGNGVMWAKLTRQHGTSLPPPLVTFLLSPELQVGGTYRLRLRAVGTTPVALTGIVEQQEGSSWSVIGQAAATDGDPTAIVTPGAAGFAAGQPEAAGYYTYSTFTRTPQ